MQGIDCHGVPPYLINPVEALKDYAATVHYTEGCGILKNDTGGLADAAADASKSDAAVMVLGLDPSVEYEMRDRTDLLLPGEQAGLVAAVRKALGPTKPLVLVLMGGGVIDTAPVDDLVDAILWVGYPGQVRQRHFLSTFYITMKIILPRQARDRHRESTQKKCRFRRRAVVPPWRKCSMVGKRHFLRHLYI